MVDEVEEEIFKSHDREVPSVTVGELLTGKLRRLDQVAYVRFASVYKQFKTLEELVDEARAVIDAKRFEDPDQGRLFIEPVKKGMASPNSGTNGDEPKNRRHTTIPRQRRPKPTTDAQQDAKSPDSPTVRPPRSVEATSSGA